MGIIFLWKLIKFACRFIWSCFILLWEDFKLLQFLYSYKQVWLLAQILFFFFFFLPFPTFWLKGTETAHIFRSWKSTVRMLTWSCSLWRIWGKNLLLLLLSFWQSLACRRIASFSVCLHEVFCPLCLCPNFPLLIRIPVTGLGSTLT